MPNYENETCYGCEHKFGQGCGVNPDTGDCTTCVRYNGHSCQTGQDTNRSACCYHSKHVDKDFPNKCGLFTPSLECRKVLALEAILKELYILNTQSLGSIADRMQSR